jgi:hypothetical protein
MSLAQYPMPQPKSSVHCSPAASFHYNSWSPEESNTDQPSCTHVDKHAGMQGGENKFVGCCMYLPNAGSWKGNR